VSPKKPQKIDVEQALSESAPPRGSSAAEEDIEIVEVTGEAEGESAVQPSAAPAAEAEPAPETIAGPPSAALAAENAALLERLKRQQAEHENYRKRVERDRAEHREQANMDLVREIAPVLDSFERALGRRVAGADEEFRSGVALIQRQLQEALTRLGLEPFEALGQTFDPEVHDAVVITQDPGSPAGRVLEVFDRGYRFRGRLVRPARVRVAAGGRKGEEG